MLKIVANRYMSVCSKQMMHCLLFTKCHLCSLGKLKEI